MRPREHRICKKLKSRDSRQHMINALLIMLLHHHQRVLEDSNRSQMDGKMRKLPIHVLRHYKSLKLLRLI